MFPSLDGFGHDSKSRWICTLPLIHRLTDGQFLGIKGEKLRVGPLPAQHGLMTAHGVCKWPTCLLACTCFFAGILPIRMLDHGCGLAVVTAQSNVERKSRVSGSAVRFLLFFVELANFERFMDSWSSILVSFPLNAHPLSGRVKTPVQCLSGIKREERHVRFITKKLVDNLLSNGQALGKACGAAISPFFETVLYGASALVFTGLLRNRPRETLCCQQGSVCECNCNSLHHGSRRLSVRLWFVLSMISSIALAYVVVLLGWFCCTKAITSPTRQK